ncbi:MAG: hypothetical protein J7641_00990 [Cyanobacteria bacterium SID2]|nr:hypothetical protein [Cyanobacteria bacterium SID2]MBP0002418.1 hypothetical protein [Cyanobacteria bacterium SBC]
MGNRLFAKPRTFLYVLVLSLVGCRQQSSITKQWHDEPINYLRSALVFQSAKYVETGEFADDFDDLGIEIPRATILYEYRIDRLDEHRIQILAIPKKKDLKSATAAVIGYGSNTRDALCISDKPSANLLEFPEIPRDFLENVRCPSGSSGGELYELSPVNKNH